MEAAGGGEGLKSESKVVKRQLGLRMWKLSWRNKSYLARKMAELKKERLYYTGSQTGCGISLEMLCRARTGGKQMQR